MNKTPSGERIEAIELNGSMAGQRFIAKDGVHLNNKGVEKITKLYQNFTAEQYARFERNEVSASDSEEDKE